jgi:hypothetical protein
VNFLEGFFPKINETSPYLQWNDGAFSRTYPFINVTNWKTKTKVMEVNGEIFNRLQCKKKKFFLFS